MCPAPTTRRRGRGSIISSKKASVSPAGVSFATSTSGTGPSRRVATATRLPARRRSSIERTTFPALEASNRAIQMVMVPPHTPSRMSPGLPRRSARKILGRPSASDSLASANTRDSATPPPTDPNDSPVTVMNCRAPAIRGVEPSACTTVARATATVARDSLNREKKPLLAGLDDAIATPEDGSRHTFLHPAYSTTGSTFFLTCDADASVRGCPSRQPALAASEGRMPKARPASSERRAGCPQ